MYRKMPYAAVLADYSVVIAPDNRRLSPNNGSCDACRRGLLPQYY